MSVDDVDDPTDEWEAPIPARVAPRLLLSPGFRLAVGDEVAFSDTEGSLRVEALLPRRSRIERPDPGNVRETLVLAANIDVAAIVVGLGSEPLRTGLIDRLLLGLESGGVRPLVCINKVDLLAGGADDAELRAALAPYDELSIPVVLCSAATGTGIDRLRGCLAGQTCVLLGHSGVGKSSLLNALDPDGDRAVGAVRSHDGKGRHTTAWSSLRRLGDGTRVIDTPGLRAFGLDRLSAEQVRAGFCEFDAFAPGCRFGDCTHVHEPACAVRAAAEGGELSPVRYRSYVRILASLDEG